MRYILILLFVLILGNVKSQDRIPNGCYYSILGNIYEFRADTLEYLGVFDHILTKGKGAYSISNKTLTCHYKSNASRFYEIDTKYNLSFNLDSVLITVIDSEKKKTLDAMIILNNLNYMFLRENSEIKIARKYLPIKIKLSGCNLIPIKESDLIDKNSIEVKIYQSNCDSIITGVKEYTFLIKQDTLVIDNDQFILYRKGCPKIIIIE